MRDPLGCQSHAGFGQTAVPVLRNGGQSYRDRWNGDQAGVSFFLSLPGMNGLHGWARTGPLVFQTTLN